MILQQDEPDDFVLATGETHTVREFVEKSFREVGRGIEWKGKGEDEEGVDAQDRQDVRVDRSGLFSPHRSRSPSATPPRRASSWAGSTKTTSTELVREMVGRAISAIARTGGPPMAEDPRLS